MSSDNNNNNNKNNRDEEQDNTINKKQKVNDKDGIDITNLNSYTVAQLKLYADKIGISFSSGVKKGEIIEKIEIVVKRNKELLAKQEIQSNVNSFNKGIIEIKIKDGIDPLEWSFWKVFRHKVLYRLIMSFMNKCLSIDYESITLVEKMIKSNKSCMLRDKVIRNQNLTFSNGNGCTFNSIFKFIKSNTDQNRLFYQRLFQNYGDYSLDFKNVTVHYQHGGTIKTITNGREKLVDLIIESKCTPALKVLIQDYKYKSTIQNFKNSISQGSSKLIVLLLQSNPTLSKSIKLDTIMSVSSLNCLIEQNLIEIKLGESTQDENYKYLLSVITPWVINEKMSLKQLINIGKLISSCSGSNSILDETEIKSFVDSLTKNELSSKLNDISNQLTTKREMIKKLIELYHSFTKIDRFQLPHLYFNDENRINYKDIGTYFTLIGYEQSIQFANIETLEFYFRNNLMEFQDYLVKSLSSIPQVDHLFSFCGTLGLTDEEIKIKQMKFIDSTINMVLKEKLCDSLMYFYLIINHGDLGLIEYVASKLGNSISLSPKYHDIFISSMIKSKEILEYLFSNHYGCFVNDVDPFFFENKMYCQQFENLLLEKKKIKTMDINLFFTFSIGNEKLSNINPDVLKYILSKQNITEKINNLYKLVDLLSVSDQDKYELCQSIYLNCKILKKKFGKSQYYIRFVDWVYENFKDQLLLNQSNDQKELIIYKTSRYQDLNDTIIDSDDFWYLLETEFDYENIGLLNYYFNAITKDENYIKNNLIDVTNSIYLILSDAAELGRLKTFEFISLYHSWILKVKTSSPTNKGLFVQGEMSSLLHTSLKSSNIKVSEFLFSLYSISESEFKKNSSDISLVYFYNKFNKN